MAGDLRAERHHLVSRSYQQNFADVQKRVAVVAAPTGVVIDPSRAIKSNFVVAGYNTAIADDGTPDSRLEREFARIEGPVADQIRRITPANLNADLRGAVANHFAMHLVRSESFLEIHERIVVDVIDESVPRLANDPQMLERYAAEITAHPEPGEVQEFITDVFGRQRAGNQMHVDSMISQYNKIVEMFAKFHVQIITTGTLDTGFVLGDIPVVHLNSTDGRHGFRDRLAIGDSDLIIGPLTRSIAAVLSSRPEKHVTITVKKRLQEINATFVRAARAEVACHPDDLRELRRVCDHLRDFRILALSR